MIDLLCYYHFYRTFRAGPRGRANPPATEDAEALGVPVRLGSLLGCISAARYELPSSDGSEVSTLRGASTVGGRRDFAVW
jgi:hypothetical protein